MDQVETVVDMPTNQQGQPQSHPEQLKGALLEPYPLLFVVPLRKFPLGANPQSRG